MRQTLNHKLKKFKYSLRTFESLYGNMNNNNFKKYTNRIVLHQIHLFTCINYCHCEKYYNF